MHRPTIIFAEGHQADELKGSARSVPGLHIRDLLETIAMRHPHLINKFGGHAMAAGLSLKKDLFDEFAQFFQQECEQLPADILQATCYTDGELTPQELALELAELLRYDAGPGDKIFRNRYLKVVFVCLLSVW